MLKLYQEDQRPRVSPAAIVPSEPPAIIITVQPTPMVETRVETETVVAPTTSAIPTQQRRARHRAVEEAAPSTVAPVPAVTPSATGSHRAPEPTVAPVPPAPVAPVTPRTPSVAPSSSQPTTTSTPIYDTLRREFIESDETLTSEIPE
jgi:hypothetical protein